MRPDFLTGSSVQEGADNSDRHFTPQLSYRLNSEEYYKPNKIHDNSDT